MFSYRGETTQQLEFGHLWPHRVKWTEDIPVPLCPSYWDSSQGAGEIAHLFQDKHCSLWHLLNKQHSSSASCKPARTSGKLEWPGAWKLIPIYKRSVDRNISIQAFNVFSMCVCLWQSQLLALQCHDFHIPFPTPTRYKAASIICCGRTWAWEGAGLCAVFNCRLFVLTLRQLSLP